MPVFLGSLDIILQDGFMYSLIAMGYYISYSILDFPDLTAEARCFRAASFSGFW